MQSKTMHALSKHVSRFLRPTHLGNERCMSCGYPRTAEAERCSECGWTPLTEQDDTNQQRRVIRWMQWSCSGPSIGLLLLLFSIFIVNPLLIPNIVYSAVLVLYVVGVFALQTMAARQVYMHTPQLITITAIMFAGAASMPVFFIWFLWAQPGTIRGVGFAAVVLSGLYLISVAAAADRIAEHRTATPTYSTHIGIIAVLIPALALLAIFFPRVEEPSTLWWMILAPGLALAPCQRALNAINGEDDGETDPSSAAERATSPCSRSTCLPTNSPRLPRCDSGKK